MKFIPLDVYSVADIIQRGGTVLHTARSERMRTEEASTSRRKFETRGIDGLVIIGERFVPRGEGTFFTRCECRDLPAQSSTIFRVPYYTIDLIRQLTRQWMPSQKSEIRRIPNNRVNIVQVMVRNSGNLALYSGLAGGAEAIVVPEIAVMMRDKIITKLLKGKERGKLHIIIVFAEGAGDLRTFCEEIENEIQNHDAHKRCSVLSSAAEALRHLTVFWRAIWGRLLSKF
jgi:6-phosphofructokinase 1